MKKSENFSSVKRPPFQVPARFRHCLSTSFNPVAPFTFTRKYAAAITTFILLSLFPFTLDFTLLWLRPGPVLTMPALPSRLVQLALFLCVALYTIFTLSSRPSLSATQWENISANGDLAENGAVPWAIGEASTIHEDRTEDVQALRKLAVDFDELFPIKYVAQLMGLYTNDSQWTFGRSLNNAALTALADCLDAGDCHKDQDKVVLLASFHFCESCASPTHLAMQC